MRTPHSGIVVAPLGTTAAEVLWRVSSLVPLRCLSHGDDYAERWLLNLRYLIEIAAWTSIEAPLLIEHPPDQLELNLHRFWRAGRGLLQVWSRDIDETVLSGDGTLSASHANWSQFHNAVEGVFLSEILFRVWAAILVMGDQQEKVLRTTPLVRNVFTHLLEARKRILLLLLHDSKLDAAAVANLDRTRRRCERWTDLLLGPLIVRYGPSEFCFDLDRARDFGTDPLVRGLGQPTSRLWDLVLSGLRLSFPATPPVNPAVRELTRELAESVINTFPASSFVKANIGSMLLPNESSQTGGEQTDFPLPQQTALPPLRPFRPGVPFHSGPDPSWN